MRLDDGWTWQLLDTNELRIAEGQAMGLHFGRDGYDEDCLIMSLRDAAGASHVTVEFRVQAGRLTLLHDVGPKNGPIDPAHLDLVLRLRNHIGAWHPACIP